MKIEGFGDGKKRREGDWRGRKDINVGRRYGNR